MRGRDGPATAGETLRLRSGQAAGATLVPEMANAGEEHGQPKTVGGGDHFRIALRAAGLNDGSGSGLGDLFHAIREWKESVRGSDRALQRELGFHGANLGGIHPAHLARSDADSLAVTRVDDGVGLHMLANFPGKEEGSCFFWRGRALG